MTCKKIKALIYHYSDGGFNELAESERAVVQTHLESCPDCSAHLERFQKTGALFIAAPHVPPTPDWNRSWRKIQERLNIGGSLPQQKMSFHRPTLQWAGVLAASILIFVVGMWIGFLIKPNTTPKVMTQNPVSGHVHREREYFVREFQDHLDNIKPVILEYANYLKHAGHTNEKNLQVEKEMVIDLLIRNQLLLCRLPGAPNRDMLQLLNELQDILTRIAAMTLDDPDSMSLIKNMIRQKGLIFKMEALRPVGKTEISL
jgi:hypothetical protein